MDRISIIFKRKLLFFLVMFILAFVVLMARVIYIQTAKSEELQGMAYEQQTRDRLITPKRGNIEDRNGEGIAVTQSVNAVSVIHAQVEDEEATAKYLAEKLDLNYDDFLKKFSKRVALVRIKTKVDKETAL